MNVDPARTEVALESSGFFVMRSPLLPASALTEWGDALTARGSLVNDDEALGAAIQADRRTLEARLRTLIADPVIDHAIEVASPGVHTAAQLWQSDTTHPRGRNAVTALARYLSRMVTRCTPFGLFAGNSVGKISNTTSLRLPARSTYRTHTRIDTQHLANIGTALSADPALRSICHYKTNSSLYRVADQLRYTKRVALSDGQRTYQLVSIRATDMLVHVTERALKGATRGQIADSICALHGDTALRDQALRFVDTLIEMQVLESPFEPLITGADCAAELVATLRSHGQEDHPVAVQLTSAQTALRAQDSAALGSCVSARESMYQMVQQLAPETDPRRLLQVDLVKPGTDTSLSHSMVEELRNAVLLMHKLCPPKPRQDLKQFRDAFRARYQEREVPLVEALDEDFGIGFDVAPATQSSASPLIAGLPLAAEGERRVTWNARAAHLLQRLCATLSSGSQELSLSDADVEALSSNAAPLPDALAVNVTLLGTPEGVARGDCRIQWHGAFGPSGALYFGRFCQGIPELEQHVREHLRAEAAHRPEAVFAEIVHLPQTRNGNIMCRPQLREFEIPFLGHSGAPEECQIPVADLMLSVSEDRIVLRSKRLNREIIPRLTTAHNAPYAELSIYRFLTALQVQNVANWLAWDWGVLRDAPFLPRVTVGKLILAPARWRLTAVEVAELQSPQEVVRYRAAQALRAKLRLPRWIGIKEDDRIMPVDLDNVLCIDILAQHAKDQRSFEVVELLAVPGEAQLCATSEEGAFMHEVVVPFVTKKKLSVTAPHEAWPASTQAVDAGQRLFAPGNQWIYAKVYTSPSLIDRVLLQFALPVVSTACEAGICDRWFYLRYADPDPHLRLRIQVPDPVHRVAIQTRLLESLNAALAQGLAHRIQFDTYDREIERYAGPAAIEWVEELFHNDSICAASLLRTPHAADEDGKWKLAMVSIDQWLTDFGVSLPTRCTMLETLSENLRQEFGAPVALNHELGARYRVQRSTLSSILLREQSGQSLGANAYQAFARRSQRNSAVLDALRTLERNQELNKPLAELAPHLIHMAANRLLQSAARAQELVIYALLARYYRSSIARGRQPDADEAVRRLEVV